MTASAPEDGTSTFDSYEYTTTSADVAAAQKVNALPQTWQLHSNDDVIRIREDWVA